MWTHAWYGILEPMPRKGVFPHLPLMVNYSRELCGSRPVLGINEELKMEKQKQKPVCKWPGATDGLPTSHNSSQQKPRNRAPPSIYTDVYGVRGVLATLKSSASAGRNCNCRIAVVDCGSVEWLGFYLVREPKAVHRTHPNLLLIFIPKHRFRDLQLPRRDKQVPRYRDLSVGVMV